MGEERIGLLILVFVFCNQFFGRVYLQPKITAENSGISLSANHLILTKRASREKRGQEPMSAADAART